MIRHGYIALLFAMVSLRAFGADLVSEALFSFPAETDYVEYDDLASLRKLPNYGTLQQRFAGPVLQDAKATLTQLGIQERQVQEVVTGSDRSRYFGLLTGTFSGEAVVRRAVAKKMAFPLAETQAFCGQRGTCIVFLEDSLAAFGSLTRLKVMLDVRQGFSPRLGLNGEVVSLLTNTDRRSPVRGLVSGGQIERAVGDYLPGWNQLKRGFPQLSASVKAVGYGIDLDTKAHVNAALRCTSPTSAATLSRLLNAFSSLSAMALPLTNTGGSPGFEIRRVSSSTDTVSLQLDCTLQ